MRLLALLLLIILPINILQAQNTIGLPVIINYSKVDFKGGSQTWDIKQDKNGLMYFANNEGLISFDGTYWKIYPLPNRTIVRSVDIGSNNRIYVGGQGEMGYFMADANGFLQYQSLTGLLPKNQQNFADIWDIEILGESVFFRATDRIFELRNNNIEVFTPNSAWQFLTLSGGKLIAQDRKDGLFWFSNNKWVPFSNNSLLANEFVSGVVAMGGDSMLVTTFKQKFYYLVNGRLAETKTYPTLGGSTNIYKTEKINPSTFVVGTTAQGCLMIDFKGNIIQKISQAEGLQNNNVLCVFLDKDDNLWAGLNNGISFIETNSAIQFINPGKSSALSGFSSRIFNNNLYVGTSDGAYVVPVAATSGDISFTKGDFSLINNSNGQVWRLDEVNGKLLMGHNNGTYIINNNTAASISSDPSWVFLPMSAVLPSKNILAGTYTGLKMLDFSNNKFTDLGNLEGIYESLRFLTLDNDNTIWASHPYRGIYKLELSKDQKKYTAHLYTDKDGLPSAINNHVFKIKNTVVFATQKGAYEFDRSLGRFKPSPFLQPIFGDMELRYLAEDEQGNIWFCSGKKIGVAHYNGPSSEKKYTLRFFPELTGKILSGFENVYPYNPENVFIGSEKGIIHLNYQQYIKGAKKITLSFGSIKAVANTDSTIFGGYFTEAANTQFKQNERDVLRFPKSYNSFHFEYSSPSYSSQSNIEYSYKLEGYDKNWSAWGPKTEKDYTNLPDGRYSFMVKAHDNLANESNTIVYTFIIKPPFYKTIWAYIFYLLLLVLLIYTIRKWQQHSLYLQQLQYEEKQKQIIALHNLEIEKNEKAIIKLQNEKLANEVFLKKKELADASMHLIEREDALARVKEELQKLYKKTGNNHDVKNALQLITGLEKSKSDWDQFASHFDEINNDFTKKLKAKFPDLTHSDLKVCVYLQLNLSSKEIAQLMNITVRGVEMSRYRIRKKLQIPTEETLTDFLNRVN
jgi:ligand-binding sensor domain-containing protein